MDAPNPAQRLLKIFDDFAARASDQRMIAAIWAEVFGISDSEVELRLIMTAGLISDIGKAVEATGVESQVKLFKHFAPEWSRTLLAPDAHMRQQPSQAPQLITPGALAALNGVAGFLEVTAPILFMPAPEELQPLREQLRTLLDELRSNSSLPLSVRTLIVTRLNDVLWAIDNIEMAGADGVSDAVDKLVGAIVLTDHEPTASPSFRMYLRRVMTTAGAIWSLFKQGPEARNALNAWEEVLRQLPPGA